jgi:membrane fusion protein, multidrug efflux system
MRYRFSAFRLVVGLIGLLGAVDAQTVEVSTVTSRRLDRVIVLPGELQPYQTVVLHSRVAGFVEEVAVDRGSSVQKGQILVRLTAPEITAQVAEAESKVRSAKSQRAEALAKLSANQSIYDQLKSASATEGAISEKELIQAQKAAEASQASVESLDSVVVAADSSLRVARQMEQYLNVSAPFDGVITERMIHPGALVGPSAGAAGAMLKLEQVSKLRLLVAVPETEYAGVVPGVRVEFTVPAHRSRKFSGAVARISHSVDTKTRSMLVELDVGNPSGALAPGMYPEVAWPVRRPGESLLVPPTSIVTTTESTFVIRVRNGKAEWVNVRRGVRAGDLTEVIGELRPGDTIVRRGSDEIREGAPVQVQGKN